MFTERGGVARAARQRSAALSAWQVGVVFTGVGCLIGSIVGRLFPPFIVDGGFWRTVLSGPPMAGGIAGVLAVVAAWIAFLAADRQARVTRKAAEREQWWHRVEWALTLARSDHRVDRLIGIRALEPLRTEATATEYEMILAVTHAVSGGAVDTGEGAMDNRSSVRRRFPWQKTIA